MKNIVKIVSIAAIVICGLKQVRAAEPAVGNVPLSLPATFSTGVNILASPQSAGQLKFQNLSFQSTISAAAPGGTNIYVIAYSENGIGYDTNYADCTFVTNAFAVGSGAGSNTVTKTFSVGAHCYAECYAVTSTAANAAVTNGSTMFGIKIASP